MKTSALGSLSLISFLALTSVACSPALSEPKAAMVPDAETSTTSLTSGEALPTPAEQPLPANRAPLEGWYRGTPAGAAKPAVQPLDPWSAP